MERYQQALSDEKREAQDEVFKGFLGSGLIIEPERT
jgi:hypothetical protein